MYRSSSSSAVLNDARSVAEAPRSPRSWRKQSAFSSFVTSPAAYRCDAVVFARSAAIIASTSSSFASASAAASASDFSRSTRSANRRPAAPPTRRATRASCRRAADRITTGRDTSTLSFFTCAYASLMIAKNMLIMMRTTSNTKAKYRKGASSAFSTRMSLSCTSPTPK